MAFPADDLPDPSTWFSNALITSALMKSNIIDAINLLPRGFLQEGSSTGTVTFSTTSAFAGLGPATFTLNVQRRVRIEVLVEYDNNAGAVATYQTIAGYNTGSSAVIGSFVGVGKPVSINYATVRPDSAVAFGSVLLAAGTYTAYASVKRVSGGQTNDTATNFYTAVYDVGAS